MNKKGIGCTGQLCINIRHEISMKSAWPEPWAMWCHGPSRDSEGKQSYRHTAWGDLGNGAGDGDIFWLGEKSWRHDGWIMDELWMNYGWIMDEWWMKDGWIINKCGKTMNKIVVQWHPMVQLTVASFVNNIHGYSINLEVWCRSCESKYAIPKSSLPFIWQFLRSVSCISSTVYIGYF